MRNLIRTAILVAGILAAGLAAAAPARAALAEEARGNPVVVETYPKEGAVDIQVDTKIMVVFSRPMKRSDMNEFTVTLNDGLSDIATNVHYNAELKKSVVTPLEELLPRHVYYVTVSRTVRDEGDEPMGRDFTLKFRTVDEVLKVPPVIAEIAPTVGADDVAVDANVELTFSADMDERTLTEENFELTSGKARVLGVVRYYPAVRRAVFVPDKQFEADRTYLVRVRNVADIRGVTMDVPREWQFRTAKAAAAPAAPGTGSLALAERRERLRRIGEKLAKPEADEKYGAEEPAPSAKTRGSKPKAAAGSDPVVVEQYPAPDVDGVRPDATVKVGFGRDIDPETLSLFNFSLREGDESPKDGNFVFGKIRYDAKAREAVFTPAGKLKPNAAYVVRLSGKIADTDGKPIGDDITWTFRTVAPTATFSAVRADEERKAAEPDLTAPSPVTLYPADRAEEVPEGAEIRAVFNEPLKEFTVNSFTFRVSDGDGDLDGDTGYDPATRTAWFRPKAKLASGRAYAALLTRGVMDLSGNYMLKERQWRFVVGGRAPGRGPRVVRMAPEEGSTVTAERPEFAASFNEPLAGKSVDETTVRLFEGEARVPGAVALDADGRTVRFQPARALKPATDYTFEVAGGIAGAGGAKLAAPVRSRFRVEAPTRPGRAVNPANSAASSHDAQIEMKVLQSLESSPAAASLGKADLELGPEEMERRLKFSDKTAVGNVAPRRITGTAETVEEQDRSKLLAASLTGTDLAMSDDVKSQLQKFLGEDTRKNRVLQDAVNEVNAAEAEMADGMVASAPMETDVDNGKTRRTHSETLTRPVTGMFDDEMKYQTLVEAKKFNQSPDAGKAEPERAFPVSNIPHTAKHNRGSGTINGIPIDDLDGGGITAPATLNGPAPTRGTAKPAADTIVTDFEAADPPAAPAEAPAPPAPALTSPVDQLAPPPASAPAPAPEPEPASPQGRRPEASDDFSDAGLAMNPSAESASADFMVTAIHPRRNGKNVRADEIVSASFNRNIDLATVNAMSFIVTQGEEVVDGKIVYNPRINKVIFRPKGALKTGEKVNVTLTNGIRTMDGDALKPLKWEFVTATM